jgi:hypothetical protein
MGLPCHYPHPHFLPAATQSGMLWPDQTKRMPRHSFNKRLLAKTCFKALVAGKTVTLFFASINQELVFAIKADATIHT